MPTILTLQKKFHHLNTLDLTILLSHTIKKTREFIFAHPEYVLSIYQRIRFWYYLKKYKQGIPIAYITGHKEFFGLDFFVNKHTLIPRPDTELMVEEACKQITNNTLLIDIGTGSGCIPIATTKTAAKKIKVIATDISAQALKIAKKNARHHNVNIQFLQGDLLGPVVPYIQQYTLYNPHCTTILTANLPYLTEEQFKKELSIQHEPYRALVASNEGLGLYETLLQQIKTLYDLQLTIHVFFEIDPSQTKKINSLIKKYLPTAATKIKKDLAGRDRLVMITT
jgi:release factor glutamine methyltransferase